MEVESGKIYRHFKGDLYVVEGVACHTETGAELVVYHPLYNPLKLFVRPIEMFFEKVPSHGYPGNQERRFEPWEGER